MTKYIVILLLSVSLIACKNNTELMSSEISEVTKDKALLKDINYEIEDTIDGGMMLLGPINRKGLTTDAYSEWFTTSQKEHTIDTLAIKSMQPLVADVNIKVFMGTWCEDSQREIPALYKILDRVHFNYDLLDVVAVSHEKDTPKGLEKGWNIEFVPTLIFIKNGDTLNRIVEYAHGTLEQDMLTILQGKDYTPAYAD